MSIIEIRHRYTNDILFSGEYETLRDAVIAAVSARANLAGAYLVDAYLTGAYLAGANLVDAYLVDAYLAGANLTGANLTGAYLAGANLTGAYLTGANLTGAYLAGAYLAGAKWRDGIILTRLPLQLFGLDYPVTVLDQHMQIGCELHTLADWTAFDNARIARMDGLRSRQFWDKHGAVLLALAASDGRQTTVLAVEGEAA